MNYALVGAFVIALSAALIAGILWLASGGAIKKSFNSYLAIEDESVSGLNINAPVKYNGVEVGKVRSIKLDHFNPERVRLIFAIEEGTPINQDTVAVLKTQGLTGIAYVELSGGTRLSAPLLAVAPEELPEIQTKPSLSARLENVLTTALAKLDRMSSSIDALLSDKNQTAFTNGLADIATVARTIAARKDKIDSSIASASVTFDNAAKVSAQLGPVIVRIGNSADAIERMGNEVAAAGKTAGKTVDAVGADLKQITSETVPELQRLMAELIVLSTSLKRLSEQTERNPSGLLFGRSKVPDGPGETSTGLKRP